MDAHWNYALEMSLSLGPQKLFFSHMRRRMVSSDGRGAAHDIVGKHKEVRLELFLLKKRLRQYFIRPFLLRLVLFRQSGKMLFNIIFSEQPKFGIIIGDNGDFNLTWLEIGT